MGDRMLYAIGDIHGRMDRLEKLIKKINFNPDNDKIVFLGDYIDRGNQPIECIKFVKSLVESYPNKVIALMGNHEMMMKDYYEGIDTSWTHNGWEPTRAGLKLLDAEEREKLLDWIYDLPLFHCDGKYIFVHAGINPQYDLDSQIDMDLVWIREQFYYNYNGDKIIVVGHTPIQSLTGDMENNKPIFFHNILFCDTGAFLDEGKLSCVNVETLKYMQA